MILSSMLLVLIFATACSNDNNNDVKEPSNVNDTTNVENETEKNVEKNNDDTNNESETDTENTSSSDGDKDKAENQDDMKEMIESLDFYEFELDVSYGSDKDYEIKIEHHSNGDIEAEVENELNDINIKDDVEAFNYIYPNAMKLDVSKDMDKQDAIDQVLKAFDIPEDYKEMDIEFEFEDGTKLEFEDEK